MFFVIRELASFWLILGWRMLAGRTHIDLERNENAVRFIGQYDSSSSSDPYVEFQFPWLPSDFKYLILHPPLQNLASKQMSLHNAFGRLFSTQVRCWTRLVYIMYWRLCTQKYRLVSKMNTQQGPINCFAIIGEGELLASGGRPSFRFSS